MADGAALEEMLRKHLSDKPRVIFDVGARGGLHSRWGKFGR